MASQVAKLAAMYFASVKLSAINLCFLSNQDIIPNPKLKQHIEVHFLVDVWGSIVC